MILHNAEIKTSCFRWKMLLLLLLIILLTLFANSILCFLGNFVLPSFSPNIDGRKRPKRRWNILSSFCLADVGSSSLSFYFSFKSSEWTQNSGRLITLSLQSGEIGWQSSIIQYFASNCRSETQTRCLHRARRDPWDLTTDITKKESERCLQASGHRYMPVGIVHSTKLNQISDSILKWVYIFIQTKSNLKMVLTTFL